MHFDAEKSIVGFVELAFLNMLHTKSLDQADTRQSLMDLGVQVREELLTLARGMADLPAIAVDREERHGENYQGDESQLPIQIKKDSRDGRDRDQRRAPLSDDVGDGIL